jgi:hypothetical protein
MERSQAEQKGSYWLWMGSLIFTAFSFEAYLNHVGTKVFACWNIFEKAVSPDGKLDILCEKLGIDLKKGEPPRQTVHKLFEFRNKLAHGRTVTLEPKQPPYDADENFEKIIEERPLTVWEEYCTAGNVLRARADIKQIMQLIHEKAMPENDFLFDFGMYEVSGCLKEGS